MIRPILAAAALILLLACSGNPAPAEPGTRRPFIRLLTVTPPPGTSAGDEVQVLARAEYRLPDSPGQYHASLMFVTERGATVSGARDGIWSVALTEPQGVVELHGRASALPHELAQPLTAIVAMIGRTDDAPARADTITGTPAEVRERLGYTRDVVPPAPDSVQVRVRAVRIGGGRMIARTRAVFYNGAGPTSLLRGPSPDFAEALAEYRTYGAHKAFALAMDSLGRRSWGYSFGYGTADSANARAMRQCERRVALRERVATCRLYAVGDTFLQH